MAFLDWISKALEIPRLYIILQDVPHCQGWTFAYLLETKIHEAVVDDLPTCHLMYSKSLDTCISANEIRRNMAFPHAKTLDSCTMRRSSQPANNKPPRPAKRMGLHD